MSAEPNDKEFEAVRSLPVGERYEHFVRHVVDFDQVWMLEDEEGLIAFNHEGREVLPVWPARCYAEHAVKENWPEVRCVSRELRNWLEKTLLPLKDADDVAVAVFPDAKGFGQHVLVSDIIADIKAELGTRLESLPGYDPDAEEIDLEELLKPAMRASMKAKPKGKLP